MTDISAMKLDALGFVKRRITDDFFAMEKRVKDIEITVTFDLAMLDRIYIQKNSGDSFRCYGIKTIEDIETLYRLITGEEFA